MKQILSISSPGQSVTLVTGLSGHMGLALHNRGCLWLPDQHGRSSSSSWAHGPFSSSQGGTVSCLRAFASTTLYPWNILSLHSFRFRFKCHFIRKASLLLHSPHHPTLPGPLTLYCLTLCYFSSEHFYHRTRCCLVYWSWLLNSW